MKISVLRDKWYYRFSKVVYIIFFAILVIGIPVGTFLDLKPYNIYDESKSTITCTETMENSLASNFDISSDYIYSWDKEKIIDFCLRVALDKASPISSDMSSDEFGRAIELRKEARMENNGSYTFNKVYKLSNSWFSAIGFPILSIFIVIIFFELVKRIFFYIFTGHFIHLKID